MSNAITLANVQVPAHLAQRVGVPSILSQSLSGGIGGGVESTARISIKGSRFRIAEGGTETVLDSTTLDVVVVGANPRLSKTWYAKAWTPRANHLALTVSLWMVSALMHKPLNHKTICVRLAHRTHGVAR